MFKNTKTKESPAKFNTFIPSTNSSSHNSLVGGTVIEGTVRSESDIRIDGTIKGKLHCKAKVIIGPGGVVEGEVTCANSVIEGKFDGKLNVSGLLHVKETALVEGEIITNKLIVQEGATFNVNCKMIDASANGKVTSGKAAKSIVQQAAKSTNS